MEPRRRLGIWNRNGIIAGSSRTCIVNVNIGGCTYALFEAILEKSERVAYFGLLLMSVGCNALSKDRLTS